MPFPTPKEYFVQGVGKPGTQQHIGWAWYHQPLLVHVLYHPSSEASDVPIFGWCVKIQHTDPLQSQLRICHTQCNYMPWEGQALYYWSDER
jgi:hypothetical protein